MNIAYLYSNTFGDHFSNHFEEFVKGLRLSGIDSFQCPPEINYKTVKNYDIIFFDTYHMHHKNIGYIPRITDKKVFNLKLGIITMDFWWDLTHHKMKKWLEENRVNDFIIFRHSSGLQFFERKFELFIDALRDRKEYKSSSFLEPKEICTNFENVLLTSFTINKDIMKQSDTVEKEYDICFGARQFRWYPIREKISNAIIKSKKFKCIDPEWKSPGTVIKNRRNDFTDYYDAISKSWLTLATTGIANISARKYFEICGLGSTCLGNHTNLPDHDIVKQNVIEVDVKMSEKQIVRLVEDVLNNKKKLQSMSESVKQKIRDMYDYREVGRKLKEDLEKVYGGK